MKYRILFPGFKEKSVTLSFDDGTFYDVILVKFLNEHGLKCTFNVNSGLFGAIANLQMGDLTIFHNRISKEQSKMLYKGHEVASHSTHHPLLVNQTKEVLDAEIAEDMKNLNEITDEKVVGFVIPGGPHDAFLDDYVRERALYERSGENSHEYAVPSSFVPFRPTTYILEDCFEKVCDDYIDFRGDDVSWLYIWGHSYEFAVPGAQERFERVCLRLAEQKDIFFGTNGEIIRYVTCARKLRYERGAFVNDTDTDLFIRAGGKELTVKAGSSLACRE